ncbi:Protein LIGHT-DEPENDENT SHORT HYPOCOTYLS 5 [Zea mays]|uniref:Protein LIGHT-DEPENDENT SHORT HYPOCOTYLS 5 n=1 Tax=Zea mays TaxID=4577 RepID=A0A1D6I4Q5_MAIZE|nr:Protein LIGHT-DEPENDENT SHORT HYPOCOTYLS 5 [Zea mays]
MRQRWCRIGLGCRSGDAVILLHVCPISVLYDTDWSAIDVSYPSLAPTPRMVLATTKMTQSQLLRAGWRTTKTPSRLLEVVAHVYKTINAIPVDAHHMAQFITWTSTIRLNVNILFLLSKIMRDSKTGNSIVHESFELSDQAVKAMNNQHFCNHPIIVSYAYKKGTKGDTMAHQQVEIHLGQPHQIRIHLAYNGHPLVVKPIAHST